MIDYLEGEEISVKRELKLFGIYSLFIQSNNYNRFFFFKLLNVFKDLNKNKKDQTITEKQEISDSTFKSQMINKSE